MEVTHEKFENFLIEKFNKSNANYNAAVKKKDEWLIIVESLYQTIENMLRPFTEKRLLYFSYGNIEQKNTFYTSNIGIYHVKTLQIHIGSDKVTFTPYGHDGVTIKGSGGEITLLYTSNKWKFLRFYPDRHLIDLTDESLMDSLQKIITPF